MQRILVYLLATACLGLATPGRAGDLWSLDLTPVDVVSDRGDGGKLVVSDHFSISLDRGVGAWSDDGRRVILTAAAEDWHWDPPLDPAVLGGEGLAFERPRTVRGPGFTGSLRAGTLRREGRILRLEPAAPTPGAGGWVTVAVLGALTLLLLRRSSTMRSRLAEPRVSLRARTPRT